MRHAAGQGAPALGAAGGWGLGAQRARSDGMLIHDYTVKSFSSK